MTFLTIKIAAVSQSDKRRMRARVATLEHRPTPICEEARVNKIYAICSPVQAFALRHFQRRESVETCIGLLFISSLAALGAALPMI